MRSAESGTLDKQELTGASPVLCACGCGREVGQLPGGHQPRRYYDERHRVAACRLRKRNRAQAEREWRLRQRWGSFPGETQRVLEHVREVGGLVLAESVADAISVEHSAGQQVMLDLLRPEVERLREELANYQVTFDLSDRAKLQQQFLAIGERLNYCMLLLCKLTTGLSRGYEAWAKFADGADDEALVDALAVARERLEAEAEIDEIVNMKRRMVRRERVGE